ncbi:MAG: SAM-dependent methyltransferase, partial [Steroidobacteraceae bacterium]
MLHQWQQGLLGRALIQGEAQLLASTFDDVFGLELLQLGTWGVGRELLAPSRIRRQSVVADSVEAGACGDLVARLAHLPINSASVDAVLLPHTLELAADPH